MKAYLPLLAAAAVVGSAATAVAQAPAAAAPTIGAARAVAAAEKALSARAIEAELDDDKGRLIYEVELVRGGSLYEARLDATTGKLLSSGRKRMESLWASWFDKGKLNGAPRPLGATLAALEAESGGRVEEVGFEADGGRAVYEVELTTGAGTAEIALDALTGKRLPAAYAD